MKTKITAFKPQLLGILAGAMCGWMYWYFVGCASGSCAITSSPVNSALYGAFLGALLPGMFKKETKKEEQKKV